MTAQSHVGFTSIIARLSCQLIGQGFRPLGFKIAITPAYLLPLGITSTNSTASNHSRAHPFQPSTQRKNTMSQHHANENINNSFNNTNSFNNVWNNCTVVDEESEILAWLSPLEPQIRHQDISTRRVGEVGDWLLQTQEYQDWFGGIYGDKSDGSALLCYGGPGVGKTYIR